MRGEWTFDLAPPAQAYISQLDGYRKEELIEKVGLLSETPMELIGRSVLGGLEIWKFEYKSDVVPDLLVTIWLSAINLEAHTMLIEFISDNVLPEGST